MKLYGTSGSGNAYKIHLLLSFIGQPYERVEVDLHAGEHKAEAFLSINPRGQVPALEDGATIIWDSQAILCYLAKSYAPIWLPETPLAFAQTMQWLAFSENELLFGLARARAVVRFGSPWDYEHCKEYGMAGLAVLNQHLAGHQWIVTEQTTIADVACYPYIALASEGNMDVSGFPAIVEWMERFEALPGFGPIEALES
ncbi:MAG: glutathione S-transferase family protein [Pseudomonadota bacterium]